MTADASSPSGVRTLEHDLSSRPAEPPPQHIESASPRASCPQDPLSTKMPFVSVSQSQGASPSPAHSHVPTLPRATIHSATSNEPRDSEGPSTSHVEGLGPSTSAGSGISEAQGDYDDGLTFVQHMIAGSIAGMTEHMAMFPVDTVKTRMQALRCAGTTVSAPPLPTPSPPPLSPTPPLPSSSFPPSAKLFSTHMAASAPSGAGSFRLAAQALGQGAGISSPSVYQALTQILKSEGPVGLYRGIGAMGLGAGPAHAVYFAVYEQAKEKLGGNRKGHQPLAHAAAGALATVASDAVLTPMDVVKQRLQLAQSPYSGVFDCCRKMMQQEGLRGFYTSYRTTLIMNVPFTAVHFAAYEAAKRALGEVSFGGGEASEEHLVTHLVAGGAAGALASAITNPLDVVKTRLQCQGVCGSRRFRDGSVLGTLRSLVKEEGPRVLWKGMGARVMFHVPAAAIVWSTYEACKGFLKRVSN